MSTKPVWTRLEIPRHPKWGGPLVIPPGVKLKAGDHKCSACGRMVAPRGKAKTGKGTCRCEYYRRTTKFIDVLQDEYKLKQWDRRMVAYGMSQRPDLVLAAASLPAGELKAPDVQPKLQKIADDAKEFARASAAATIGTSLHALTEQMDLGQTLGHVPDPYGDDLKAYEQTTKDIEWVAIESFRVHDDWKVAGTTDRLGWYKGRLRAFDIKTGGIYGNGMSQAMQLAMYARSTPYDIGTDTRTVDVSDVDLTVAYIIHLPAGQAHCELMPVDISKGWGACRIAQQVWSLRNQNYKLDDDDVRTGSTFADMVARASKLNELNMLWRNAKDQGRLTPELKDQIMARGAAIKAEAEGVSA